MSEQATFDRNRDLTTPAETVLCICGHPRSDHYEYICNGQPTVRCHGCDPSVGWTATNITLPPPDSYVTQMYYAADHPFETPGEGMPKRIEAATLVLAPSHLPGIYGAALRGVMAIQDLPIRLRWIAPGWSTVWVNDCGWQIVDREDCGTFHDPDEAVAAAIRLALDPDQ